MIIGTKRREEIIPRSQFKYKTALVLYKGGARMLAFTRKSDLTAFVKKQRKDTTAATCVTYVDYTGHATVADAAKYWAHGIGSVALERVETASGDDATFARKPSTDWVGYRA